MSNLAREKQPEPMFSVVLETDQGDVGLSTPIQTFKSGLEATSWESVAGEGKLAVDVAESVDSVIVVSTIAGAAFDRIEVYLHNDLLTIRGERPSTLANQPGVEFVHEECFWGRFSRTIVLPCHVKADLASAEYRSGVLTITIPKRNTDARIPVKIIEE